MSDDGGRSWRRLLAACQHRRRAAELLRLGPALLLAGGRRTELLHDALIWLSSKGDASDWRPFSLSYQHNRLLPAAGLGNWSAADLRFSDHLNTTNSWPWECSSYTSLVQTGESSAVVLYNRFDDATGHGFDFAMPVTVV